MSLRVYYDLMSQPCRALLIFLKKNNIPFESKVIALRKGQQKLLKLFLCDKIKVLDKLESIKIVGSFSVAMVRYLAREFPIQDNWYPQDSKAQARVDEYLEWQHLNTRLFGSMVFRERVITPLLQQKPVNEEKLQFYKKGFLNILKEIEEGFLKDRPYLCGDSISVADIFCACEVEQPLMIGFDALANSPVVKAWLEKVRKELEPHYSEVHGVTKKMRDAIQKGKL
ncbi:unnamed protein product [Larinioides sclopetarius]|uniref:Glutathione S-transferase n=1 Tax=Larinioides sclopetarius TaxID=280406 RepID=A0AAV1ZB41_9ARAC